MFSKTPSIMRTFLIVLLSSVLASAQQSPRAFMTSWGAAFNKNDAKTLVSYYDPSEDTDCLVSDGTSRNGFKLIKEMYEQDMKAVHFYDSKTEEMRHRILGNAAVVSFVHKIKFLIRETGEHRQIHVRTTAALRKDNKSWKIVSEHSSPIKGIERAKTIQKDGQVEENVVAGSASNSVRDLASTPRRGQPPYCRPFSTMLSLCMTKLANQTLAYRDPDRSRR